MLGSSVEATQAAKQLLKVTWTNTPNATLDSEQALEDFAVIARDKTQGGVDYPQVRRRRGGACAAPPR